VTSDWTSAIVVLVAFTAVMGALEMLARRVAPPSRDDPRLGARVFWVWAVAMAIMTYGLWPFLESSGRALERIALAVGVLLWLAWKLAANRSGDGSPREREEIWASTVGTMLGCIAWVVRHG
jgi:hypothetical protein